MCGICGVVGLEDKNIVSRMVNVIDHRGPDDKGFFIDDHISLGMTRLSIVDLKTGHQPIHNEEESIWVFCNGEIYNFPKLTEELEKKGHNFYTKSDVEVIVHAYEEYGTKCVEKFKGMFSFALWDKNKERLLLGRDKVGIKPLYYTIKDGNLIFGSEVKSIIQYPTFQRKVNKQALYYLLNLRYVPGSITLFDGVSMLPPAHTLVHECNKIRIKRYWKIPSINGEKSEGYYVKNLQLLLEKAVKRHLISDVPLGIFLSGGIDSSTIVAYASKLSEIPVKTFTVKFSEQTDEVTDAQRVAEAFNTEHHTVLFKEENLAELLPKLLWHVEEPRLNIFQEYIISHFASNHVKVGLGGLGGDELFAGYELMEFVNSVDKIRRISPLPKVLSDRIVTYLMKKTKNKIDRYEIYKRLCFLLSIHNKTLNYLLVRNFNYIQPNDIEILTKGFIDLELSSVDELFKGYFNEGDYVNEILHAEFETKLPNDFLLSEDKTYMANSLEGRVPLLDADLVDFAFTIPSRYKISGRTSKYIFKKAMTGVLPRETIGKKKWGFSYNPQTLFEENLRKHANQILDKKEIKKQGILNYRFIERIMKHPPSTKLRWHYKYLTTVMSYMIWHKIFIEQEDISNPKLSLNNFV